MELTRSEPLGLKFGPWVYSILALFLAVVAQTWGNHLFSAFCLLVTGHGLYIAIHHAPRRALAASYLVVLGQVSFVIAADRPVPSETGQIWLGILGLAVLPIAYGISGQLLTRRWWFSAGILLLLTPLVLTWLLLRDYARYPLDMSMSSFLAVGLVGLIGPAIAIAIQTSVALVSSGMMRLAVSNARP